MPSPAGRTSGASACRCSRRSWAGGRGSTVSPRPRCWHACLRDAASAAGRGSPSPWPTCSPGCFRRAAGGPPARPRRGGRRPAGGLGGGRRPAVPAARAEGRPGLRRRAQQPRGVARGPRSRRRGGDAVAARAGGRAAARRGHLQRRARRLGRGPARPTPSSCGAWRSPAPPTRRRARAQQLLGPRPPRARPAAEAPTAFERARRSAARRTSSATSRPRASAPPPSCARLRGLRGPVAALAVAPDGRTVAAGSGGRGAPLGRRAPASCSARCRSRTARCARSPSCRTTASWSWASRTPRSPCGTWLRGGPADPGRATPGFATSLAVLSGGRFVVSGGSDRVVRLWDPATGRLVREMAGHEDAVTAVAAGATRLVSASRDGTARLWALEDGRCLGTLRGHEGRVLAVALDERQARVVSAGDDGTVRDWGLRSHEPVRGLPFPRPGRCRRSPSRRTARASSRAPPTARCGPSRPTASGSSRSPGWTARCRPSPWPPTGRVWAATGRRSAPSPRARCTLPAAALCRPASASEEEARASSVDDAARGGAPLAGLGRPRDRRVPRPRRALDPRARAVRGDARGLGRPLRAPAAPGRCSRPGRTRGSRATRTRCSRWPWTPPGRARSPPGSTRPSESGTWPRGGPRRRSPATTEPSPASPSRGAAAPSPRVAIGPCDCGTSRRPLAAPSSKATRTRSRPWTARPTARGPRAPAATARSVCGTCGEGP